MGLESPLLKGDPELEACLIRDSAHLTLGAAGRHVSKVQQAVLVLGPSGISNRELAGMHYGGSTAAAVLKYKQDHTPPIINPAYQKRADDIVGKMTIAALDEEIDIRPSKDPLTNPDESSRILQLLEREHLGVFLMLQTTSEALLEVQTAFKLAEVNPEAAAGLLFVHRFTVDGLERFFAVNLTNHEKFLPKIIANFKQYMLKFPQLSNDQGAADYGFLLRHGLFRGADGVFFLDNGRITKDTPMGFSSVSNPHKMLFTPRYREFDPTMPPLFRGLFREALRGIQIHEMGHFYFNFDDGSPTGKSPKQCLRLAVSYDLLARQTTFRHLVK